MAAKKKKTTVISLKAEAETLKASNTELSVKLHQKTAELGGLIAAFRLRNIELARAELTRWDAERNHASARSEIAHLKLVLAERESLTGVPQMPVDGHAASRFFNAQAAAPVDKEG